MSAYFFRPDQHPGGSVVAVLTGWLEHGRVHGLAFELRRPDETDKDDVLGKIDRYLHQLRAGAEPDIDLDEPNGHSVWFRLPVFEDGQVNIQFKVEGVQDITTRAAAPLHIAEHMKDGVSRALSDEDRWRG